MRLRWMRYVQTFCIKAFAEQKQGDLLGGSHAGALIVRAHGCDTTLFTAFRSEQLLQSSPNFRHSPVTCRAAAIGGCQLKGQASWLAWQVSRQEPPKSAVAKLWPLWMVAAALVYKRPPHVR
ncbi:unnamed protein product [Durusdinium trenchii]|uniref:Uncharacterized protein n=1 Tax=Durusdinium trenchii TaxID=1381693 RepID=A0ABP0ST49_9DINO